MSDPPKKIRGPLDRFTNELKELIVKWSEKPLDDVLTYEEMVGAIEVMKARLMRSYLAEEEEETEEE